MVTVSVHFSSGSRRSLTKAKLTVVEREEAEKYAWTEPAFRAVYEQDPHVSQT